MSSSDGSLSSIEHIVVVVMENRSFDNVLGLLYDPKNPDPRFKAPPPGQTFNGVIEFPAATPKAEASNPARWKS